ncbi:hypothetical protein EBZ80_26615 [bacterium]|nr:hypothetical protein [bacterium]
MKKHVILDLDNCIADDSWRIPNINWQKANPMERYHDYHSLSAWDRLCNARIAHDTRYHHVIFTARPVLYRAVTEEWLRRWGVFHEVLIMRNNEDHTPSVELKRRMLQWLPEHYGIELSNIEAAYDDRPDVVEMYKQQGINGQILSVHDVCAYTNPNKEAA